MMKPTIALCSDDPELYMLLRHILAAEGYATTLVAALPEINDILIENRPHAIIVDCSVRGVDAIELCRQIRKCNQGHSDCRAHWAGQGLSICKIDKGRHR